MSKITFKEYRMLKKTIDEITNINSHCADRYLTVEDINDYNGKIIDPNYNKKATRHKMKASEKMLPHVYLNMMLNYLADKPRLRKSIKLSGNPKFSYLIAKNVPYYTMTDSGFATNRSFKPEDRFEDNDHLYNYAHNTEYGDVIGEEYSNPDYNSTINDTLEAMGFFVDYTTMNVIYFNNIDLQRNVIKNGTPILWAKYARDVHDADVELLREMVMTSDDEEAKRIFTEEVDTMVEEKCPLQDIIDKYNSREISTSEFEKGMKGIRGRIYGSDDDMEYRSQLFKSSAKVKTLK